MKISVSLSEDDVAAVDDYARTRGLPSRSAVVQHAVRQLHRGHLERDYRAAFAEWDASGEREAWETAAADGVGDAPR